MTHSEDAKLSEVEQAPEGFVAGSNDRSAPLDALLEEIGEGFFALDAQWRFQAFNRAAEVIFNLPRAEVMGRRRCADTS